MFAFSDSYNNILGLEYISIFLLWETEADIILDLLKTNRFTVKSNLH